MIIIIGIISSFLWGAITWLSFGLPLSVCQFIDKGTFNLFTKTIYEMRNGFHYNVNNNDMPTGIVLSILGIIFILFFIILQKIKKNTPHKHNLPVIIFFAILFRLILLPGVLIHENDIYRYLWDGKSSVNGINPFKYAPSDLFMYEYGKTEDYYDDYNKVTLKTKKFSNNDKIQLDKLIKLRDQKPIFFSRIGHWQIPTIYPPIIQVLFMLPAFINPHSLILMKLLFIFFDIGIIFLVIMLLKHFHKNPSLSVIYAWCPLVLFEFTNRGHYDAIPIFFTLLAIYLVFKSKQVSGSLVLALATLSKFFSGILLPILMRPVKKRYWLVFGVIFIFFYLPYFFWNQTGVGGVFEGLLTYNKEWAYNASIFALIKVSLQKLTPPLTPVFLPAKLIVGSLYLIFVAFLIMKKTHNNLDTLHRCFLAIAGLFILNPVGDPWYFCWSIPFLCFFPYSSWILLSGLLPLSYLNFHSDLDFIDKRFWNISLISWVIYIPFFICLMIDCYFAVFHKFLNNCKVCIFKSTKN